MFLNFSVRGNDKEFKTILQSPQVYATVLSRIIGTLLTNKTKNDWMKYMLHTTIHIAKIIQPKSRSPLPGGSDSGLARALNKLMRQKYVYIVVKMDEKC